MANWTNTTKNDNAFFASPNEAFLLQQSGYFLLLQNGGKIMLNQATGFKKYTGFTNQAKS
jgi:hypothetical protein